MLGRGLSSSRTLASSPPPPMPSWMSSYTRALGFTVMYLHGSCGHVESGLSGDGGSESVKTQAGAWHRGVRKSHSKQEAIMDRPGVNIAFDTQRKAGFIGGSERCGGSRTRFAPIQAADGIPLAERHHSRLKRSWLMGCAFVAVCGRASPSRPRTCP